MSETVRTLALALALAVLGGCTGFTSRMDGNLPRSGSVVPNTTLQLAPSLAIPLEKLVYWGAFAGVAYLILDPLAPNWQIRQAKLPHGYVHLSLKMRRYYVGGAGEARVVFRRRAQELMEEGGFDSYQVMDYTEGLESSVLGSQRVAEGVIRLVRNDAASQGSAPPARSIPDKTMNPRS